MNHQTTKHEAGTTKEVCNLKVSSKSGNYLTRDFVANHKLKATDRVYYDKTFGKLNTHGIPNTKKEMIFDQTTILKLLRNTIHIKIITSIYLLHCDNNTWSTPGITVLSNII